MNLFYLKQATASQSRMVGPFLDDTDFKTPETGLTIANTDVKLCTNGGASADKNSGGGTHRANGMYALTFDATDSATVGEIQGSVVVAGALPVYFRAIVLEEAVYDMFFGAGALGYIANAPVNVAQFGGSNGTFASGRPEVNVSHFGGTAGTFSGGRPEVNATLIEGSDATNTLKAAVVEALATDTYAEPGQGTPGATITLAAKIGYMYKALRNRHTQDATTYRLYNDDATTVDQKASVSDNGTTFDRGEIATGP